MPDIELLGATYPDVPAVDLPKSGGGIARFYDPDELNIPTCVTYTGTLLSASWTGSAAPYSYSLTVSGMLATDTPVIDIVMSGTYATDTAVREAWSSVYRAVSSANTITFYSDEVPSEDISVQILCIRD